MKDMVVVLHIHQMVILLSNALSNALKKTVMYRAIAYWRVLPPHLTLSRSTFCFKRKLKAAIVKREITLE